MNNISEERVLSALSGSKKLEALNEEKENGERRPSVYYQEIYFNIERTLEEWIMNK